MQGRDDVAGFIAGFAGDDRYIVDYLVEEVLQRQPEHVRSFLLQTSILDRLTGHCAMPSPARTAARPCSRRWSEGTCSWSRSTTAAGGTATTTFRRRAASAPAGRAARRCPELHRRASDWYEQNGEPVRGDPPRAGRRGLRAGGGPGRAGDASDCARVDRTPRCVGWLEALPDEVIRVRPVLSIAYVGALMVSGELEGVEARLRDAERWLATTDDIGEDQPRRRGWSSWTRRRFRRLPGAIAIYRAGQAMVLGDVAGTMTHARRALELAGEDDHFGRGGRGRPSGTRVLDERGSGCSAALVRRWHGQPGEGRVPLGRARLAPSPWRTSGSRKAVSARP